MKWFSLSTVPALSTALHQATFPANRSPVVAGGSSSVALSGSWSCPKQLLMLRLPRFVPRGELYRLRCERASATGLEVVAEAGHDFWSGRAPGYSAAMSDYGLSEKSNLTFFAMGRQAQAKSPERIAATLRSQASILCKMSREVPERI